jgi:hypothetical protein
MINVSRKKFGLVALTCFLILAALCGEVFAVTHLDHDCTGGSCPVCLQIETIRNLFRALILLAIAAFTAILAAEIKTGIKTSEYYRPLAISPVALKVKFSS